jgi:hypothetical protein
MAMVVQGDEPLVEVVAAVAKSPVVVAVAKDEPPVEIVMGVAQSPVAEAVTPFAASPFDESKDIHLSCTKKTSTNWQKITRETIMQKTIIMKAET